VVLDGGRRRSIPFLNWKNKIIRVSKKKKLRVHFFWRFPWTTDTTDRQTDRPTGSGKLGGDFYLFIHSLEDGR